MENIILGVNVLLFLLGGCFGVVDHEIRIGSDRVHHGLLAIRQVVVVLVVIHCNYLYYNITDIIAN